LFVSIEFLQTLPTCGNIYSARKNMSFDIKASREKEKRNAYRVLVGKPEGRRPLGRPRHSWVDNIEMDLQEVG